MPRYRRRPEYVEAVWFWPPHDVPPNVERGQDGIWRMDPGRGLMQRVIKPGRWLVTDEHGTTITLPAEQFEATYEAAD